MTKPALFSRAGFPPGARAAILTEVFSCSSSSVTRYERRAKVVTVPMAAPTTAISATAETTSRVRSDQGRRPRGRRFVRRATTRPA